MKYPKYMVEAIVGETEKFNIIRFASKDDEIDKNGEHIAEFQDGDEAARAVRGLNDDATVVGWKYSVKSLNFWHYQDGQEFKMAKGFKEAYKFFPVFR